jgi:NADPH2:quinone reductase
VSTEEKARITEAAGADHVILYTQSDFEEEVKKLTNGKGADVVYDSVGRTTFEKSIGCLKPRGLLALFGQSSGAVTQFDLGLLSKGSLFITRPSLGNYAANRAELLQRANDLFQWINTGKIKLRIHKTFPLQEAAEAHKLLEGRQTSGKLLLIP